MASGDEHGGSALGRALRWITTTSIRAPRLTVGLVLVSAALAAGYTLIGLRFKSERADLIDPRADFHQRWIEYTASFGDDSDLVVVVEDQHPERIRRVLEDLGSRIVREPQHFRNVLYKIRPGRLRGKGLQYFSPQQLAAGLRRLNAWKPVLTGRWDLIRVDRLFTQYRHDYQQRTASLTPVAPDPARMTAVLEQAGRLAESLARYLADPQDFRSPWPPMLPADRRVRETASDVIYLLNERGTVGFLKAVPASGTKDSAGKSAAVKRLRALMAEVHSVHPSAKLGLTGIPVLESDEMSRSQSDMLWASLISFVGVGLVLFVGFRGIRHPALALVMLAVGMAWTFGYTTFAVGHLNILSVSFAVILIGLGIDFAIHYLARYLELRHKGRELRPALKETSTSVGIGIVTAAVTTALAFFCATLTQFLGVAELGIIAGGGILLCAAATFIVLPALVALADGRTEPARLPAPFEGKALQSLISRWPRSVLIASLCIVAGIGAQVVGFSDGRPSLRVGYDNNLLNLQAAGVESVDLQKRLFHESGNSLLFAVSIADSARQARELRQRFEELPTVGHVEDLASRLPAHDPADVRLLVQTWRNELSRLPRRQPVLPRMNPAAVGRSIEELFLAVRGSRHPAAEHVARATDWFLDRFERLSIEQQLRFLESYQIRAAGALVGELQTLGAATNPEPITATDLPDELVSRYRNEKGQWLLQIYPREQIWDEAPLERFVTDVRSVDPEVTGTPLQNYEASRQIRESYETAAMYALAVIFLVLLVDFLAPAHKWLALAPPALLVAFGGMLLAAKQVSLSAAVLALVYVAMAGVIAAVLDFNNLRDALLAMLPPVAGALMMFGLLGLAGIDLNPANLIVLPLVLGIGVDDGVHVVHDFRIQRGGYRTSPSTMNAIVLTSLTSMIGFGSMMVAAHRGLYSVGLVLVVGVGCCLFVSLVPLPAILTVLTRRPGAAPASERANADDRQVGHRSTQSPPLKRAA